MSHGERAARHRIDLWSRRLPGQLRKNRFSKWLTRRIERRRARREERRLLREDT